jgi:glycosyltransferase involved in cell wall biosynthesis
MEEEFRLLSQRPDVRLLFVDDGSGDDTNRLLHEIVRKLQGEAAVLSLPKNRGKAEAVRQGMLRAVAEGAAVAGYIDADMSTPARQVLLLLDAAMRGGHPVTLGSRVRLLGTAIQRRPVRHYTGRVFATAASLILKLPVYDTQCGAKFFRVSETLQAALSQPFISRWIFDVELIGRLLAGSDRVSRLAERDFIEIPLQEWRDVKGSKISSGDIFRVAADLALIAIDLKRRRQQMTAS